MHPTLHVLHTLSLTLNTAWTGKTRTSMTIFSLSRTLHSYKVFMVVQYYRNPAFRLNNYNSWTIFELNISFKMVFIYKDFSQVFSKRSYIHNLKQKELILSRIWARHNITRYNALLYESVFQFWCLNIWDMKTLGVSPSLVSRYCEGYSFYRLQDLEFKISEGLDQNWSCPESAQLAVSV